MMGLTPTGTLSEGRPDNWNTTHCPAMAELYRMGDAQPSYVDRKWGSEAEFKRALAASSTLYIGNLSFFTTEEQLYEIFSKCGEIKRMIMGLDRVTKTPCGFCFVEFYTREDAADAVKYISGTKLDDRVIRVDWDAGFKESRQFGRGISGGQVRDEYRTDFDPGRGGYGRQVQAEMNEREAAMARYEPITEIPRGGLSESSSHSVKRDRESDDTEQPPQKKWRESRDSGSNNEDDEEFEGRERNPRFREERGDKEEDD